MADPETRLLSRRFRKPVAKTNLVEVIDYQDPPEGATPRTFEHQQLWVDEVDMMKDQNGAEHRTSRYDIDKLVVRRGQNFTIRVTFSQEVSSDDVQLEFLIGTNPNQMEGSRVIVSFGWNTFHNSGWTGQAVQPYGFQLDLVVRPDPMAIVGKYRCYVVVNTGAGTVRSRRNAKTDLYLLFNPWCPEDWAYYPVEKQWDLEEYVLKDSGFMFVGTEHVPYARHWHYGQFDAHVLDACIYILDAAHMPIRKRSNLVSVIRKASAMLNSQDDNGVLVGNWSEDYTMGTAPTAWSGSTKILKTYANSGSSVCYAQCWVYAGVFTTFLRCMGIASRPVTNFSSAHDNTRNLKVDLIFLTDGTPDRNNTRDSIWNYHCWNEVYMKRVDLPPAYSGWQAVDATPQETSEGLYRCGPASIVAIKTGQICYGYDSGFILAEVNSDVVFHKYEEGHYKVFRVEKSMVGKMICTKAVGSNDMLDLTHEYKYPEGTAQNQDSLDIAEGYGMVQDHTVIEQQEFLTVNLTFDDVYRGSDISLTVNIRNLTREDREFSGGMDIATEFYTGISDKPFYHQDIHTVVKASDTSKFLYTLSAKEYLQVSTGIHTLQATINGLVGSQLVAETKLIELRLHPPSVVVTGDRHVNGTVTVAVSFTNVSDDPLLDVDLAVAGTYILHSYVQHYDTVDANQTITYKVQMIVQMPGHYTYIGKVMLQQVYESTQAEEIDIEL